MAMLDALGMSLSAKLRDAIAFRATSGIETVWTGDTEFYEGYDDANRDEFANATQKPTASGGYQDKRVERVGSSIFPNITAHYVDAAAARVGDMLLPTDDRNFMVEATPIPDIVDAQAPQIDRKSVV